MWFIGIPAFVVGVLAGVGIGIFCFRHTTKELLETRVELEEAREFNKFCLDHASDVLTAWLDYKETHEQSDEGE